MNKTSGNIKCIRLKNELADRILAGEFAFGSRFPGVNDLCKAYKISYVTVCKAVKLLESDGFLRCQPGIGYFVCCSGSQPESSRKEVNVISTPGYYRDYRKDFDSGMELFKLNGWKINLLLHHDLYELKPAINTPGSFSIITAFNINWERFAATFGQISRQVIVLGRLSGNPEITSIVADECASIRLCMDHFRQTGRKKVALATLLPRSELAAIRIAAWRNIIYSYGFSLAWMRRHLLTLDADSEQFNKARNKELIRQWLSENLEDTEAIILPSPMKDFVETVKELGIAIPEKLAITTIGWKQNFRDEYPEVFTMDNNYADHFRYALEILEDRLSAQDPVAGSWYFCQPSKIITD